MNKELIKSIHTEEYDEIKIQIEQLEKYIDYLLSEMYRNLKEYIDYRLDILEELIKDDSIEICINKNKRSSD